MIKHTIWKSKPGPVTHLSAYSRSPYWERREQKARTQEEIDEWFKTHNWEPGQILVYDHRGDNPASDIYPMSVVVLVEKNLNQVVWEAHHKNPQMFKMMGLSHWSPSYDISKTGHTPYLRWTDGNNMRELLPSEEHLINDNLQNYIKDAIAKYQYHWCFRG